MIKTQDLKTFKNPEMFAQLVANVKEDSTLVEALVERLQAFSAQNDLPEHVVVSEEDTTSFASAADYEKITSLLVSDLKLEWNKDTAKLAADLYVTQGLELNQKESSPEEGSQDNLTDLPVSSEFDNLFNSFEFTSDDLESKVKEVIVKKVSDFSKASALKSLQEDFEKDGVDFTSTLKDDTEEVTRLLSLELPEKPLYTTVFTLDNGAEKISVALSNTGEVLTSNGTSLDLDQLSSLSKTLKSNIAKLQASFETEEKETYIKSFDQTPANVKLGKLDANELMYLALNSSEDDFAFFSKLTPLISKEEITLVSAEINNEESYTLLTNKHLEVLNKEDIINHFKLDADEKDLLEKSFIQANKFNEMLAGEVQSFDSLINFTISASKALEVYSNGVTESNDSLRSLVAISRQKGITLAEIESASIAYKGLPVAVLNNLYSRLEKAPEKVENNAGSGSTTNSGTNQPPKIDVLPESSESKPNTPVSGIRLNLSRQNLASPVKGRSR
jgi:hypothetical protein